MKHLVTATALSLIASPALAHPGDHHEVSGWSEAVQHLLSSPFHLALVAGAIVLGFGLLKVRSSRRRSQKH
ncbi:hypothetical protein [Roseibium sp. MMSF_3412]|uniref:hypothetical protein n=1 Tax=unclassified Roseibium TaxID=2629323 RepID=UPI00273D3FA3|nr:hypothetical protein [Roseibium sp. MMSF_3412]